MTGTIAYSHRFVANSDTRKRFARALLGYAYRTKRPWVFYSLLLVIFTLLLMSGRSRSSGLGGRVFWAVVFALLPTPILAVWASAMSYFRMVRRSRWRLFNGAVLESGFGEGEMVFRNPLASVRLSYKGVRSVTARGKFVFMQMHGVPVMAIYRVSSSPTRPSAGSSSPVSEAVRRRSEERGSSTRVELWWASSRPNTRTLNEHRGLPHMSVRVAGQLAGGVWCRAEPGAADSCLLDRTGMRNQPCAQSVGPLGVLQVPC